MTPLKPYRVFFDLCNAFPYPFAWTRASQDMLRKHASRG